MPEVEETEYDIDQKTFDDIYHASGVVDERQHRRLRLLGRNVLAKQYRVEMQEEQPPSQKNREKSHRDYSCACG